MFPDVSYFKCPCGRVLEHDLFATICPFKTAANAAEEMRLHALGAIKTEPEKRCGTGRPKGHFAHSNF